VEQELNMNALLRFVREEEGVTSLEYALLAVVIAMVIYVGAKTFGTAVRTLFESIAAAIDVPIDPIVP